MQTPLTRGRHQSHRVGFPHSEIPGSKVVRTSTGLIAAYHVFHRLYAPRHPLETLVTLDSSISRGLLPTRRWKQPQCLALMREGYDRVEPSLTGKTRATRIMHEHCQTISLLFKAHPKRIVFSLPGCRLTAFAAMRVLGG